MKLSHSPIAALIAVLTTLALSCPARATDCSTSGGTTSAADCTEGIDGMNAQQTSQTLSMVYMAPASVCTTACVTQAQSGGTQNMVCNVSNVSAGATDGVMTQNYETAASSATMSLAAESGAGASTASNAANQAQQYQNLLALGNTTKIGNTAPLPAAGGGSSFNFTTACATALMDSGESVMNMMAAQQAQQVAQNAINDSNALAAPVSEPVIAPGGVVTPSNGSGQAATALTGSGSSAGPCGNVTDLGSAVQCAQSTGQAALAAQLSDPGFPSAFQQSAGMPFSDYLAKAKGMTPAQQLAMGMSGSGLPPDSIATMASAVDQMQPPSPSLNGEGAGATYASAPGGNSGNGSGDPASAIAGMMKSMFGGKKDPSGGNGLSTLSGLGKGLRKPASVADENRSMTLFERVTYRYGRLSPFLLASDVPSYPPMAPELNSGPDRRN